MAPPHPARRERQGAPFAPTSRARVNVVGGAGHHPMPRGAAGAARGHVTALPSNDRRAACEGGRGRGPRRGVQAPACVRLPARACRTPDTAPSPPVWHARPLRPAASRSAPQTIPAGAAARPLRPSAAAAARQSLSSRRAVANLGFLKCSRTTRAPPARTLGHRRGPTGRHRHRIASSGGTRSAARCAGGATARGRAAPAPS